MFVLIKLVDFRNSLFWLKVLVSLEVGFSCGNWNFVIFMTVLSILLGEKRKRIKRVFKGLFYSNIFRGLQDLTSLSF